MSSFRAADRNLSITSLDDPRLADWRIGIHMVGDDYAPPAHRAGAARGLAANIVGLQPVRSSMASRIRRRD